MGHRASEQRDRPAGIERRARYRFFCAAAVVAALGVVSVAVATAATPKPKTSSTTKLKPGSVPSKFSECQPIQGPEWRWPDDNFPNSDLYQARISSTLYESFVINYDCSKARAVIQKLINETLPITTPGAQNKLLGTQPGGVPGFICIAYPDANGRAYGGECRSGLVRFAWNYNVIWKGVQSGVEGRTSNGDFEPMAGIEYDTVLTPLGNNHYRLQVWNTSGIGTIDSFTWQAPPQLTITSLDSTSGGPSCQLAGGAISCQGKLAVPLCLCTGSGGSVTVEFTATGAVPSVKDGVPIVQGLSWSYMHITAMTPVPRLVPDVVQQLKKNL